MHRRASDCSGDCTELTAIIIILALHRCFSLVPGSSRESDLSVLEMGCGCENEGTTRCSEAVKRAMQRGEKKHGEECTPAAIEALIR